MSDVSTAIRHHHTALHVLDLVRSAEFYVDGLGLSSVEEWTSGPYIGELFGRPGVKVRRCFSQRVTRFDWNLYKSTLRHPPSTRQGHRPAQPTWPFRC